MIKYYDITEDELSNHSFEAGSIYYCNDTLNIYYDSISEGKRIHMNGNMIILETEVDKDNMIAPIANKFYYIKDNNKLYTYSYSDGWVCLNNVNVVQPDLAQNDETQPDFVKNRLAYTEFNEKVIFSRSGLDIDAGVEYSTGEVLDLVEGSVYNVKWNNEIYKCTCAIKSVISSDSVLDVKYIGNAAALGLGDIDNNMPFLIASASIGQEHVGPSGILNLSDTHIILDIEISLADEIIHKIDPKYYDRLAWEDTSSVEVIMEDITLFVDEGNGGATIPHTINLKDGDEYTVTIDGVKYTSTAFTATIEALGNVMLVCLGNREVIDGTTGVGADMPFAIITNVIIDGSNSVIALIGAAGYHTISITRGNSIIHKIDPKYYDRLAWEDTYSVEVIMEERLLNFDETVVQITPPTINLKDGDEYTVTIDGVKYTSTAFTAIIDGFYSEMICLGNREAIDGTTGVGADMPFAIITNAATDGVDPSDLIALFYTGDHTISITRGNSIIHKIDPKYYDRLAWEESSTNVLLSPIEVELNNIGINMIESVVINFKSNTTYAVNWNGIEYIYTDIINMDGMYSGNIVGIGNGSLLNYMIPDQDKKLDDTGEPFAICTISEYDMIYTAIISNTPAEVVTVGIKEIYQKIYKIDSKYLPTNYLTWDSIGYKISEIYNETVSGFSENFEATIITESPLFEIEIDREYEVIWDGISYNVTGYELSLDGTSANALGSNIFSGNIDYPFMIVTAYIEGSYMYAFCATNSTSDTHSIIIKTNTINTIDKKFLPEDLYESIPDIQEMKESIETIVNKDIPEMRESIEEVINTEIQEVRKEIDDINSRFTQKYIVLLDSVTDIEYMIEIRNGNIVSYIRIIDMNITKLPTKTSYIAGEYFDPTGMVVEAVYSDGSTAIIDDYNFIKDPLTSDINSIEITHDCAPGIKLCFDIFVFDESKLIDFEYTKNDDGTYTLNEWKGTLNGEESTEIVIPNSHLIIV